MKRSPLFLLWAGLFILCAGLGFIPDPSIPLRRLLTFLSALFFLPPALLLYRAKKAADPVTVALIRNLSILSLGLTLVLLVANILCAPGSEIVGTVLHYTLVIVSSPMVCSGRWAMSLFFWACLLTVSLQKSPEK